MIYINPYRLASTISAPSGVYVKDLTGADNHVSIIVETGGGPTPVHIADGETISVGAVGMTEPVMNIVATSEQTGGDAATSWQWNVEVISAGAMVDGEIPFEAEDITGEEPIIIVEDPSRNPQIRITLTSANPGGSASSSPLTFTIGL